MKKAAIFFILFCCVTARLFAQGVRLEATQPLQLSLSSVIEISFTTTNATFGVPVAMAFTNPNDFIKGIESAPQEIKVKTNKAFNVNVKAKSSTFEYSGSEYPAPQLPIDQTLSMAITENVTGGTLTLSTGGSNNYFPLSSTDKNIIVGGGTGNNQKYSVKYKAKPGSNVPDGTYAVDLVFTAAQE